MDITVSLILSGIALVGLKMSDSDSGDKFSKNFDEQFWTHSPIDRVGYGLSSLAGVVFVLGLTGYLTITEHWWYILVYIGMLIGAIMVSFLIKLALSPFHDAVASAKDLLPAHGAIWLNRFIGSILIIASIILFFILAF